MRRLRGANVVADFPDEDELPPNEANKRNIAWQKDCHVGEMSEVITVFRHCQRSRVATTDKCPTVKVGRNQSRELIGLNTLFAITQNCF